MLTDSRTYQASFVLIALNSHSAVQYTNVCMCVCKYLDSFISRKSHYSSDPFGYSLFTDNSKTLDVSSTLKVTERKEITQPFKFNNGFELGLIHKLKVILDSAITTQPIKNYVAATTVNDRM